MFDTPLTIVGNVVDRPRMRGAPEYGPARGELPGRLHLAPVRQATDPGSTGKACACGSPAGAGSRRGSCQHHGRRSGDRDRPSLHPRLDRRGGQPPRALRDGRRRRRPRPVPRHGHLRAQPRRALGRRARSRTRRPSGASAARTPCPRTSTRPRPCTKPASPPSWSRPTRTSPTSPTRRTTRSEAEPRPRRGLIPSSPRTRAEVAGQATGASPVVDPFVRGWSPLSHPSAGISLSGAPRRPKRSPRPRVKGALPGPQPRGEATVNAAVASREVARQAHRPARPLPAQAAARETGRRWADGGWIGWKDGRDLGGGHDVRRGQECGDGRDLPLAVAARGARWRRSRRRTCPTTRRSSSTGTGGAVRSAGRRRCRRSRAGWSRRCGFNPVLLKPSSDHTSQVVLLGQAVDTIDAANFRQLKARCRVPRSPPTTSWPRVRRGGVRGRGQPGRDQPARHRLREHGAGPARRPARR